MLHALRISLSQVSRLVMHTRSQQGLAQDKFHLKKKKPSRDNSIYSILYWKCQFYYNSQNSSEATMCLCLSNKQKILNSCGQMLKLLFLDKKKCLWCHVPYSIWQIRKEKQTTMNTPNKINEDRTQSKMSSILPKSEINMWRSDCDKWIIFNSSLFSYMCSLKKWISILCDHLKHFCINKVIENVVLKWSAFLCT